MLLLYIICISYVIYTYIIYIYHISYIYILYRYVVVGGVVIIYHIIGCNLVMSDGILVLYILVILTVDQILADDMVYILSEWRNTIMCRSIGVMLNLSLQMNLFCTLAIGIDRYFVIVIHPFDRHGFTIRQAIAVLIAFWCISAGLSLVLAFNYVAEYTTFICMMMGRALPTPIILLLSSANMALYAVLVCLYCLILKQTKHSLHGKNKRNTIGKSIAGIAVSTVVSMFLINLY